MFFYKVKKHVFYVFLFENQCFYHLWYSAIKQNVTLRPMCMVHIFHYYKQVMSVCHYVVVFFGLC